MLPTVVHGCQYEGRADQHDQNNLVSPDHRGECYPEPTKDHEYQYGRVQAPLPRAH